MNPLSLCFAHPHPPLNALRADFQVDNNIIKGEEERQKEASFFLAPPTAQHPLFWPMQLSHTLTHFGYTVSQNRAHRNTKNVSNANSSGNIWKSLTFKRK